MNVDKITQLRDLAAKLKSLKKKQMTLTGRNLWDSINEAKLLSKQIRMTYDQVMAERNTWVKN